MYVVEFIDDATNDLETAGYWYSLQLPDLDISFYDCVSAAIDKIHSDIVIYMPVYRKLSRVFVKRFPYVVYFRKDKGKNTITVFGILHEKQNRGILKNRV